MRDDNRGAIEMSIGTIVTIVLAMSMLILGMVLVKNIFSGSSDNVLQMNDQVKDQINKLFTEDKKTVIYLSNQIAQIEQNENWGVGFAIKNLQKGSVQGSTFSYEVVVSDPDLQTKCGISDSQAQSWITAGRASNDIILGPGETYFGIVRFLIPDGAPLCIVRYNIRIMKDGSPYYTEFFDVEVTS